MNKAMKTALFTALGSVVALAPAMAQTTSPAVSYDYTTSIGQMGSALGGALNTNFGPLLVLLVIGIVPSWIWRYAHKVGHG